MKNIFFYMSLLMYAHMFPSASSSSSAHSDKKKLRTVIISSNPYQLTYKICRLHLDKGTYGVYALLLQGGRPEDRSAMTATEEILKASKRAQHILPSCREQKERIERTFTKQLSVGDMQSVVCEDLKPSVNVLLLKAKRKKGIDVPKNLSASGGKIFKIHKEARLFVTRAQIKEVQKYLLEENIKKIIEEKKFKELSEMLKKELFASKTPGYIGCLILFYKTQKQKSKIYSM